MPPNDQDGWKEWSRYVLKKLEDNDHAHDKILHESKCIKQEVGILRTEIAVLKIRAGLWGAFAGAIPAALLIILKVIGII